MLIFNVENDGKNKGKNPLIFQNNFIRQIFCILENFSLTKFIYSTNFKIVQLNLLTL